MNALRLSRSLGWFSFALGATEVAAPHGLARLLGLTGRAWLVRAFGVREVAAGLAIFGRPDQALGPALRVAGDALDLAVLASALSPRNRRRDAAEIAFAMVLGVTALDVLCAAALVTGERRRAATAQRARLRHPLPAPRARTKTAARPARRK